MNYFVSVGAALFLSIGASALAKPATDSASLESYRRDLENFREEFGGAVAIPDARFFLFGMGQRTKYLYRDGLLSEALTGKIVRRFSLKEDTIIPPLYRVAVETKEGERISITEDEQGVWLSIAGAERQRLPGTQEPVKLPDFSGHSYPSILRVLHHELLINTLRQGPMPNFFVYTRPWYRDAAMMAMCFKETGNLHQVRDWILSLRDPYDRNNRGESEADNLGQVLYLISLVSNRKHPLVESILAEIPKFEVAGPDGPYISGRTDFGEHPVYQTKWLKFGLRSLGLTDRFVVPRLPDSYSALFWMDYKAQSMAGAAAEDRKDYPYLGWASDHFYRRKLSPISNRDYPLTWEARATQADYQGIIAVSKDYVERQLAAPHTWHAAEVFMYLLRNGGTGSE